MSGTSGRLTTSNIFVVGRTIPFDDERPNNEKNLLSCLSDTTTERIAMKHKGDDSGMNSFAVNYMFSSLCTLAVLLLWGRELFDRWLQAKHCLLGCYACTDD